ncbi:MAG: hypothetical protein COA67_05090 [Lutibacter sp.]|nr:MAG: hypothetical protein COA67_05090 [Lutibacter sp.]
MILFRFKNTYFFSVILMLLLLISCANKQTSKSSENKNDTISKEIQLEQPIIIVGADRISEYIPFIKNKNIAIVANQTSVINVLERRRVDNSTMGSAMTQYHLVDYLNANYNIKIKKVFSPEHGFRGDADAGEKVTDGRDVKTGLEIVSLYGKNKKPTQEQLEGVDTVVFDIQDVGVRFYTYISTLHYVMEACAEANIPVIVLDRPNPNGHYIDGPMLEIEHKSFVGMHPVPVVYGMTIGEYAQMINGENWLENNLKCDLTVIPLKNYKHDSKVHLTIKPSPNLPNDTSINLYPSLCFFEGTNVSVGRGTELQFQIVGSPLFSKKDNFSFTPKPNFGSKFPKNQDRVCYGYDLTENKRLSTIDLSWLLTFNKDYTSFKNAQGYPYKATLFNSFFTKLAGTKKLQQQIEQGLSEEEIRKSWESDLDVFKKIREKYLIYD